MNDKYSPAKCAQYGRRLAVRLCDQHFGSQPHATLDGPALLQFTPIRQLNLFIVRQLLQQWQGEAARLRSPYFNFEAAAVQTALAQLMNTLSRHICLGRTALEPLLAQAAADALSLVVDPQEAFQRVVLGAAESFTAASLHDGLRYIDIDKEFYQGFAASLPTSAEALTREFVLHRFELYHAANYKAHQPVQRLVEALSALLPLTDLLEDGPVASVMAVAVGPAVSSSQAGPAAAVASQPTPVVALPMPASAGKLASSPSPEAPVAVPLYEKLKASQADAAPLAAALRAAAPQASSVRVSKVESLRSSISINQRFSFINELFNGENMEYHAAIQHLDSLPDASQARAYVTDELAQHHDWSRKEEHVGKLLQLIERKFA